MAPLMKLPSVPSMALVALALAMAHPATASKQPAEPSTTRSHFPPLFDCGPPPVSPAQSDGPFRANVLSLLQIIPSAAAAAPAGFVAASVGSRDDSAFGRALCFGARNRSSPPAAAGCLACLSAAARDVRSGCGGSRRAGVWRAGCFLGYADTAAASAREHAFRGWFYAGPNTTAAMLEDGVCAGDLTKPDCDRCFEDAARAAAALRWLVRMRGEEVIVVGYGCCLRVQISMLPMGSEIRSLDGRQAFLFIWIVIMMLFTSMTVVGLLLMIIIELRDIPEPVQ